MMMTGTTMMTVSQPVCMTDWDDPLPFHLFILNFVDPFPDLVRMHWFIQSVLLFMFCRFFPDA
jgi:hypothetical protein